MCWKKNSNELNGTGNDRGFVEKELSAPMSRMISSTLYQPAPAQEPSGQKHQNQITFSPPKKQDFPEVCFFF